ncbi:putative leucine-rich repeat domain, L domain-containing protein [Medicago truncatula]|uniref:Putative leucine-rich repeat domain, L domain-containing protein n=1 Tax=Medicago truncatula TaxID=3880 RepID=G7JEL0_MEDTR|nr:unknown [Medicago truncatula]KEH15402.1 hypothetical protein MTR_1155s0010 [Medicago truncatula]KEH16072.1 hypothetical protein MTR_0345s0020 [Medicago truncatula]KEH16730.1 hypothetical protein MTR_0105s0110 [Medicago truncatula]RHN59242.1 putative leucine-rich repeat domain, L domain-containing protein [Medicago truncatula]
MAITLTTNTAADLYLPDECWERVFKFLTDDDHYLLKDDYDNRGILNCISLVSKEFLSIINRIQFSLTLNTLAVSERIFRRFTNLTSLNLSCYNSDLNVLLHEISRFPLNLTSLNLSYQPIIPADGLRVLSQNITTLNTLK